MEDGAILELVVVSSDGSEMRFKVKSHTPFAKMFIAYAKRQEADVGKIRFLYDGQRLRGEQTPGQLGMEDGDRIDCKVEATGGSLLIRKREM